MILSVVFCHALSNYLDNSLIYVNVQSLGSYLHLLFYGNTLENILIASRPIIQTGN